MGAEAHHSDRNLTRDLDATVATRRLLTDNRVPLMVEAGCGTGKNTGYFNQIADRVQPPSSEGMLAVARNRVVSPKVTFQQADLTLDWPCPAKSAHLVSFNLVLEHIESIAPVLRKLSTA